VLIRRHFGDKVSEVGALVVVRERYPPASGQVAAKNACWDRRVLKYKRWHFDTDRSVLRNQCILGRYRRDPLAAALGVNTSRGAERILQTEHHEETAAPATKCLDST
jgi:hypothetical protein